jgi:protease I
VIIAELTIAFADCQEFFTRGVKAFNGLRVAPALGVENLRQMRVAILVDDGFEQVELTEPRKALERAGAVISVVSPKEGAVRGWNHTEWGEEVSVDVPIAAANAGDFDALLLSGGVMNRDKLKAKPQAVAFARAFFDEEKLVAAICHGPRTVIEAGAAGGRTMTSPPSLQTDLRNTGADCSDRNLVTSRKPDDLPAFNREMVALFAKTRSAALRRA